MTKDLTFVIWSRGVKLLIDAVSLALNNNISIFSDLLPDVGVKYPGAFAVTAPVTALASLKILTSGTENRSRE